MLCKLIRIGKDVELRYTANNKAVATISGVYDVGWGDNKKSQWIEAALWGNKAEALSQYLTKGKQVVIYADDVCIETYDKKDGSQGFTLRCRVVGIDLTSGGDSKPQQTQQQPAQHPQQTQPTQSQMAQQQVANAPQTTTVANNAPVQGFDDNFDSDLPF